MNHWQTLTLVLAIAIFATAATARLAHWISRRTFAALWGTALALNATRATTQERYGWAAASAICVLLMAWIWWKERPPHAAPLPPALRYGRAATAAAVVFTAGAAWLTTAGHWLPAAALLYTAAFFAWIATREYAQHRRTIAEHDWARRRSLGEDPPPLDPCCRLGRASYGAAHDHLCTDLSTRQTDDPRSAA